METLITGLVLAGVSGLTYLAYKHQSAYAKLHPFLWAITMTAFIVLHFWGGATGAAFNELLPFIPVEKWADARAAIDKIQVPIKWLIISNIAILAYLWFLSFLPRLLEGETKRVNDSKVD